MKSADYWRKRSEQVHNEQFRKTDKYMDTTLKREYDRAAASIRRDIEVFYQRFAINNEINLSDARKLLNSQQLNEFKMSLEEFTNLAKNNPDGRWTQILNNVYYKVRVSRLQALQIQIEAAIQAVNMKQDEQMTDLLSDVYTDTYHRTMFEIQKGLGIGASFAKVGDVKSIVQQPWLEENYSKRIWKDNGKLVQQLQTQLTQSIIRGDSIESMTKTISERMGVGYRSALRLVRTEASHIQNEASFSAYRASGVVQKYEFLATLDKRTSSICRSMDNKVFPLAEKEIGVNFPPLHANCRSTTVPYFDDEIDPGVRIARDSRGTYYVPANTSYHEWYSKHVENGGIILKGTYTEAYQKKLLDMHGYFSAEGINFTEHALNKAIGRIQSKRISSKEDILDTIKNGKTYKEPDGTIVKFGNGMSIHFAADNGDVKSVVPNKKPKKDWSEVDGSN